MVKQEYPLEAECTVTRIRNGSRKRRVVIIDSESGLEMIDTETALPDEINREQSGPNNGTDATVNESTHRETSQPERQQGGRVKEELGFEEDFQNVDHVRQTHACVRDRRPKFLKGTATILEKITELEQEWKKVTQENEKLKAEKQSYIRAATAHRAEKQSYIEAATAHRAEKQSYIEAATAQDACVKALERTVKALEGMVKEKVTILTAQDTRIRSFTAARDSCVKEQERTVKALETVREKVAILTAQDTRIRNLEDNLQEKEAAAADQDARVKAMEAIAEENLGKSFLQAFVAYLSPDSADTSNRVKNI